MAPRPSQQRRTIAQNEHIYEFGVAGRKTGITLKDSGIRDEHGMEPLDALFSSPHKANGGDDDDDDDNNEGSGEEMDITNTSGIGPAALLNGHGNASRLPMPLPRAKSPIKTNLNSPAQRNRLLARSSSPTRGSIHREHEPSSSSQPVKKSNRAPAGAAAAARRLDFNSLQAGARSLSQPMPGKAGGARGASVNARRAQAGQFDGYEEEEDEEEEEEEAGSYEQEEQQQQQPQEEEVEEDEVESFVEESMVMLNAGDDDDIPEDDEDARAEEESARAAATAAAAKRKPGRKPKAKPAPAAAKPTPAARPVTKGKKPAAPVVAEEEEEEEEQEEEEEEGPAAPSPPKAAPGKRGRPAKNKAAAPPAKEPSVPPPSSEPRPRKRRSLTDVENDEQAAPRPANKRQRVETTPVPEPAPRARGRPPAKKPADDAAPASASASTKKKPAAKPTPASTTKPGRKRKSSVDPGDVSAVAVPRGPPLPRSRGLLINRREVPGDASSTIKQTRSGRNSFKPLAFWRNEHVDYDHDEAMTDHFATKSHPSKFLLPSIKEVVRVDEPERVFPTKARKAKTPSKRQKNKSKSGGYHSDSEGEDGLADPWELNPGAIEGEAVVWHPDHEFNPPALDDEVEVTEKQLAISGAAIQTLAVKDASFRYAKAVSEGFFGAGVVDLPAGSEKRPKNSRKMFMTFFVFSGRVLVTVNETSFRISKGGMWFVPRGNYYSIENDYDQPARIFFSQGCEVAPRPTSSEGGEGGAAAEQSYMA
ncbi:kinetochore CENP-C fungal-like protein [Cercophora scortea]|uniref:CENP-C homolog n=1 Tax=Cercophora scortea TaxID=314031 RepID=A0AAE0M7B6_9PEZI|nr:kinetochore CENP-C fungal-like protein [Cercophora scortea]